MLAILVLAALAIQERVEPKSGLALVLQPGGSFHLGCEERDTQCEQREKPARDAVVAPFWLGKTQVTAVAYERCVAEKACTPANQNRWGYVTCTSSRKRTANHPVNCVDWQQAGAFCAWMGARLPMAEEWEFAAKGGEGRVYAWGDGPPDRTRGKFNFKWQQPGDPTDGSDAVGAHPAGASRWGALDLGGNVGEWTGSSFDEKTKEVRGGSWLNGPRSMRSSARWGAPPDRWTDSLGFRCAVSASSSADAGPGQ
jgi:formylglycine-generating enzyme required for sulfatase activity